MEPGRVFVCYAREDASAVDRLVARLTDTGICVWRDTDELLPGHDWAGEIRRAINSSSLVFLACFSAGSVSRPTSYQNEELMLAVEQLRRRRPDIPWLIPVRFDDCQIPDLEIGSGRTLASIQRADLFGEREAVQAGQLIEQIRQLAATSDQITSKQNAVYTAALSAYLEQVRRIAPPDPPGLIGRERELAELARFCLDPEGGYAWWRAAAWAGKSALMSTFVLSPPAEVVAGLVRIVSFFVTARLAAQDTREAFTEVLIEQLSDLTGREVPPTLPEATRDAVLLDLLRQAAATCQDAGGRLVLVVDGLDEDHSVTIGPHAQSIAGLLPASLPAGMKVIVASRTSPPVPDDVPDWHPLRDPAIIVPLDPSPYARNLQRLASQELRRLLHGTRAEQDVLGLLAAARGGLTVPDLTELTGTSLWEVDGILRSAAGRTFTSGPAPLVRRKDTCSVTRNSMLPPDTTWAPRCVSTLFSCVNGPLATRNAAGRRKLLLTCCRATSSSWPTSLTCLL